MVRVRQAGWLIGIPPLAIGLEILRTIDTFTLASGETRDLLTQQFAFWSSDIDSDFRPRVAFNLILFVAAGIACLYAITTGRGRTFVIAAAGGQAFVALCGLVWDFSDRSGTPSVLVRTIPVQWGRWTAFFYLACALIALAAAMSVVESQPIAYPPPGATY